MDLYEAAKTGDMQVAHKLANKETLAKPDKNGDLPIHIAARHGHADLIHLFIDKGQSNLEKRNNAHRTPLEIASYNGQLKVAKLLLSCGVRKGHLTSSQLAQLKGHAEIVDLFKPKPKRVEKAPTLSNKPDNASHTPRAVEYGDMQTTKVDLFKPKPKKVEKAPPPSNKPDNASHILQAIEYGDMQTIKKASSLPPYALHTAIQYAPLKVVLYLADKVKGNLANTQGLTPLHLAAIRGNVQIMQKLLATKKSGVNDKDPNHYTPLRYAVRNSHADVVRCLVIDGKAKIDKKDIELAHLKGFSQIHTLLQLMESLS